MNGAPPAELEDARRAWLDAANASDAEAYAALLTEDAVWLPPGLPAIVGRGAIRDWLAEVMGSLVYELTLDDVDLRMAGSWACETGRFHTVMTDEAAGEQMEHEGRYLVLWSRRAEAWRIDRYVDLNERRGEPTDRAGQRAY